MSELARASRRKPTLAVPRQSNRFEPFTLLSALPAVTSHIGFVATLTPSYTDGCMPWVT